MGRLTHWLDRGLEQLQFRHIMLLVRNYTNQAKPERRKTNGDEFGCRAADLPP
ncbi:hypothetical protein HPDFL43_00022360 [Hoeflea phototrophica DFL-43]|uniref:Uncharacterized protein n=1 Tax=Hoeflea phototrophica (strain DSM 17068 / NCIMB 14078 / DFL-43) TaxID=411684 RepID=A0A094ZYV0_HOEPD|nr:hypothetical protein HPDFL43_00022360 [Hoeflea phototrophica DFL-43]